MKDIQKKRSVTERKYNKWKDWLYIGRQTRPILMYSSDLHYQLFKKIEMRLYKRFFFFYNGTQLIGASKYVLISKDQQSLN